jgi:hypothetical protein
MIDRIGEMKRRPMTAIRSPTDPHLTRGFNVVLVIRM